MIRRGEVDWTKIFAGSKHFHVSGITPALSASAAAEVTGEALEKRQKRQVARSVNPSIIGRNSGFQRMRRVSGLPMMADVDILITTGEISKTLSSRWSL